MRHVGLKPSTYTAGRYNGHYCSPPQTSDAATGCHALGQQTRGGNYCSPHPHTAGLSCLCTAQKPRRMQRVLPAMLCATDAHRFVVRESIPRPALAWSSLHLHAHQLHPRQPQVHVQQRMQVRGKDALQSIQHRGSHTKLPEKKGAWDMARTVIPHWFTSVSIASSSPSVLNASRCRAAPPGKEE